MKNAENMYKILKTSLVIGISVVLSLAILIATFIMSIRSAFAMPFYDLNPSDIVLRASFYTSYSASSNERKHNIALAAKALNNTLVESNGEFSFNRCVGERTEKRGYKKAKIIVSGEFVDGIGGGVCQVSTTLYNAVILAGLNIIECHPHSLPVSYVEPSFDAMVNSGWADLKFINNTHNPIIIKAFANGDRLLIEIWGQKMKEQYIRKSVVTKTLPALEEQVVLDTEGNYPDIFQGEYRWIRYGKEGLLSEGYVVKVVDGKAEKKKIRSDRYSPTRGLIVYGTTEKPKQMQEISENLSKTLLGIKEKYLLKNKSC